MRCPQCIKEGKRSVVTQGPQFSAAVYYPTQWDEAGNLIVPGPGFAPSWTEYSCSNGHVWKVES